MSWCGARGCGRPSDPRSIFFIRTACKGYKQLHPNSDRFHGRLAANLTLNWHAPPPAGDSTSEVRSASPVSRLLADVGHYRDALWTPPSGHGGSCAPPLVSEIEATVMLMWASLPRCRERIRTPGRKSPRCPSPPPAPTQNLSHAPRSLPHAGDSTMGQFSKCLGAAERTGAASSMPPHGGAWSTENQHEAFVHASGLCYQARRTADLAARASWDDPALADRLGRIRTTWGAVSEANAKACRFVPPDENFDTGEICIRAVMGKDTTWAPPMPDRLRRFFETRTEVKETMPAVLFFSESEVGVYSGPEKAL